ncbi:MAG: hypothetical protein U0793_19190 [Gemmataceae bacterium]
MNEPWFDPNVYSWIPGTALGTLAGIWGALAGVLAPQGKAKTFVLGMWWLLLAASVACLAAGIVALVQGQPYGVWYGLGLAGVIGTFVLGPLVFVILQRYRQAEAKRIEARDLQ